jgi:8-oxo-dGTP pyrophosphatase MutT (NUDIX family)
MLDKIRKNLERHQPLGDDSFQGQKAAVLIPVTLSDNPLLILTLRATDLTSHGGEVALPGGKHDLEDATLLQTALRETEEEIDLHSWDVEVVGQLKPFISKHGLLVTPFVGLVPEDVKLTPNLHELETIFRVPLNYLLTDPRTSTNVISRHGMTLRVPTYHYEGHRIWGLTAMILVEFLNVALEAGIE